MTIFVLSMLIVRHHLLQYCCKLFRHFCKPVADWEIITRSSANIRQFNTVSCNLIGSHSGVNISGRSERNRLNSRGLSTQPCFTPTLDLIGGDKKPSTLIRYKTLLYILSMILIKLPHIPFFISLYSSAFLQTVSKADLKSTKQTYNFDFAALLIYLSMIFFIVKMWSKVLCFSLYAIWQFGIRLLCSENFFSLSCRTVINNLDKLTATAIPL